MSKIPEEHFLNRKVNAYSMLTLIERLSDEPKLPPIPKPLPFPTIPPPVSRQPFDPKQPEWLPPVQQIPYSFEKQPYC